MAAAAMHERLHARRTRSLVHHRAAGRAILNSLRIGPGWPPILPHYMRELGVHVQACSNEASAAAMLGASIHYPLRGAVTWKSIVGTNVAADALSILASPGVKGGALIVGSFECKDNPAPALSTKASWWRCSASPAC
jgi:hypothetical protein